MQQTQRCGAGVGESWWLQCRHSGYEPTYVLMRQPTCTCVCLCVLTRETLCDSLAVSLGAPRSLSVIVTGAHGCVYTALESFLLI